MTLRSDMYYIFIQEGVNGRKIRREENLSRNGRGNKDTDVEDGQERK
jgi:hypothetical protein